MTELHLLERDLQQIEARLETFERETKHASSNPLAWAVAERLVFVDVPLLVHDLRLARARLQDLGE
jgi:hypothetical protein